MGKYSVFSIMKMDRLLTIDDIKYLETNLEPERDPTHQRAFHSVSGGDEYISFVFEWATLEHSIRRPGSRLGYLPTETWKSYEVRAWIRRDRPLLIVFSDLRVHLQELASVLQEELNIKANRLPINHGTMESLGRHPAVSNVYEVEWSDPRSESGVSSVSIAGHSLLTSETYSHFSKMGLIISKMVLELSSDAGTFLATVFRSGVVVLSPYTAELHAREFLNILISIL